MYAADAVELIAKAKAKAKGEGHTLAWIIKRYLRQYVGEAQA